MTAVTTSLGQGNLPSAFEESTERVEDAIWERPVPAAYRHALRSALVRQSPGFQEHSSKLTQNSLEYDWYRSRNKPQIKFVSMVHPDSTQLSSRFESHKISVGEALNTVRQQEVPSEVNIVFTAYPDNTQRSSGMDGWHFGVVAPSESLLPQQWIDLVFEVDSAANALDISRQLMEMKELENGWADGMQPASEWGEQYGKAPSHEGLDWLAMQFHAHYARSLPQLYLYPTPEGGVQAEWSLGANEVSLEINLGSHVAEWHCLDLHTYQSSEKTLSLDDEAAWGWLVQELRQLGSAAE